MEYMEWIVTNNSWNIEELKQVENTFFFNAGIPNVVAPVVSIPLGLSRIWFPFSIPHTGCCVRSVECLSNRTGECDNNYVPGPPVLDLGSPELKH